jgi:hypothetical protein
MSATLPPSPPRAPYGHPGPPWAPPPPPFDIEHPKDPTASQRRGTWVIVTVIGLIAAVTLLVVGIGIGASSQPAAVPYTPPPVVYTPPPPSLDTPIQPAPIEPEEAAQPAEADPVKDGIGSGIWVVGEDIPAGTYKTKGPAAGETDGYYARLKNNDGSLGDIINNNFVEGPTTVTLHAGEYFESHRCQPWKLSKAA